MEQITGTVLRIIYTKAETGFTVAQLQLKEQEAITIVGIMPSLQPGESLLCQGSWKKHSAYGKQFEVSSFEACMPCDIVGIQKYLESGVIKGIGPIYAKKIVSQFGTETINIIDNTPEKLADIEGIGPKRMQQILSGWKEQASIRKIMVFLRGHEVGASFAQKIYYKYKEDSIAKVLEDPFNLIKTIGGIGFKTADKIAASVGIAKDSLSRIEAGLRHVFQELESQGHTCYPKEDIIQLSQDILEVSRELIEQTISSLLQKQSLFEEEKKIWGSQLYYAEQGIATEIQRLIHAFCSLRKVQLEQAISWVQEKLRITLAKEQAEAVCKAMENKCLIITGGPGTGKSTITKAILRITEKLTDKILLVAPTGRAAKRMSEITYKKAFTIHSILEMDFLSGMFKKNHQNRLSCDLLIIDEASMIDTRLMYYLLRAIPHHARVILIGDVDQLPSVGAGSVLKDLIESHAIPTVRLNRIFRQAAHSRIITNAHKVNQGTFPDITPIPGSDFLFLPKEDPQEITEEILSQMQENLTAFCGNVQLLSPMRKGPLGIDYLNTLLQQTFNPSDQPFIQGERRFHLQDKVMQIKNNYQKELYNGDIGKITAIDKEEQIIEITFDGTPHIYTYAELEEIVLAYAVSIHKYQGSECDCIILPMHTSHFKLLNKNLLYTGITRGKKRVILIGTKKAIAIAVHKEESLHRHTGLKERICKQIGPCLIGR